VPTVRLFPQGGPRPTSSRAEQAFYRALAKGLPGGWTAWHSMRVRTRDNKEGEADFVLAIPGRGIVVVEVKGGAIEVKDGRWLQNGKPLDRPPREQAHDFAHLLREKLQERSDGPMPVIAIATAFPDTPYSKEPSQGDVAGAVIGQHELPFLDAALPELAERLFAGRQPIADNRWLEVLHKIWGATWIPLLTLGMRVHLRKDELVPLDRDQIALLDLIDDNARMLVLGGPGTGKTLLAREMHARRSADGRRTVLLCWTRALAAALRATGCVDAFTVREFAADLLDKAMVPVQGGAPRSAWTPETWDTAPLQAAADAVPAVGTVFDAVIVDEAQDFTSNDWDLVKAIAGDGSIWAFGDEAQSFWSDRAVPGDLFPARFSLQQRYRCPEALAAFADLYRGGATAAAPGPVPELRVVRAPSEAMVAEKIDLEIHKAKSEGAHPGDIAVLSLAGQQLSKLCSGEKIGKHAVVRADDPRAADFVVADTFLRFKGLERPIIIVTELGRARSRYDVRMHIALTRATVACVVVATAEEIAGDARLAALGT
jgi:hypothetical protein